MSNDELFRTVQIKHHSPSSGYKYLWAYSKYPIFKRFRSIFCRHKDIGMYSVEDSDPGWMKTVYHHAVCKKCGKLMMVNKEKYKGIGGMRKSRGLKNFITKNKIWTAFISINIVFMIALVISIITIWTNLFLYLILLSAFLIVSECLYAIYYIIFKWRID